MNEADIISLTVTIWQDPLRGIKESTVTQDYIRLSTHDKLREEHKELRAAASGLLNWIARTPSNQCWGRGLHEAVASVVAALGTSAEEGDETS